MDKCLCCGSWQWLEVPTPPPPDVNGHVNGNAGAFEELLPTLPQEFKLYGLLLELYRRENGWTLERLKAALKSAGYRVYKLPLPCGPWWSAKNSTSQEGQSRRPGPQHQAS